MDDPISNKKNPFHKNRLPLYSIMHDEGDPGSYWDSYSNKFKDNRSWSQLAASQLSICTSRGK